MINAERYMSVRIGPALLASLLLVACGANSTANPGADYERLVAPSNRAIDELNIATSAQPWDVAKVRAVAKLTLDTSVKLNSDLLTFEKEVGPSVQAHVEAARAGLSKEIADLEEAVKSTDDQGLNRALVAYFADAQADAATFVLLHSDLGLPPPS